MGKHEGWSPRKVPTRAQDADAVKGVLTPLFPSRVRTQISPLGAESKNHRTCPTHRLSTCAPMSERWILLRSNIFESRIIFQATKRPNDGPECARSELSTNRLRPRRRVAKLPGPPKNHEKSFVVQRFEVKRCPEAWCPEAQCPW